MDVSLNWTMCIKNRIESFLGDCAATDHSKVIVKVQIQTESNQNKTNEYRNVESFKNFFQYSFNQRLKLKRLETFYFFDVIKNEQHPRNQ